MKIQDSYLSGAAPSEVKHTQQAPGLAAHQQLQQKHASPVADSVGVSELSLRLLELARSESPERLTHLARLAEQVRSGRYQVDALALSQRLVEEALGMPL